MTDEQPTVDPEQEKPEGEHQQDDVEDLALDAADAEEVKGGGWPNVYVYTGGAGSGPI